MKTMYWSHLETYQVCAQQFLWRYGWEGVDLGNGPGRSKTPPVRESKHHAVMGIVIQAVIERMYNDELWREPKGLLDRLMEKLEKEMNYQLGRNYVDWAKAPTRDEMMEDCRNAIIGFIRTMKHNRLLGQYARSEVELLGFVNKYTPIGGKADLIIRRDDNGVSIYDGKNSQTKGKYTSPDQLRWYALCFYLQNHVLPDRLGFIYFRYPAGTPIPGSPEVESGVDMVEFSKDDVARLAETAAETKKMMHKEKFEANPSPKNCKFCVYETVCPERTAQRQMNSRPRVSLLDEDQEYGVGETGF